MKSLRPLIALLALATTAGAATFTVTNTANTGAGSLRQAVANANAAAGPDTVVFDASLSGQTITLNSSIPFTEQEATNTVDGSALASPVTISGAGSSRLFTVEVSSNGTLRHLILTAGDGTGTTSSGNGGAIYAQGPLTVEDCVFSNNVVTGNGGAIRCTSSAPLTVTRCTFTGNSSGTTSQNGGAIFSEAPVVISLSTFSGNTSFRGGAVRCQNDNLIASQSTFTGNTATSVGGALSVGGNGLTTELTHVTITANHADTGGGGIHCGADSGWKLANSIVSGNTATTGAADIENQDPLEYIGANLVQTVLNSGTGTVTGPSPSAAAPLLAALGNYGGPTQTMPPLTGSPAINSAIGSTITTDQRGVAVSGIPDLGATENSPTISNIQDLTVVQDSTDGQRTVAFTIGDAPGFTGTPVLSATSTNTALVPGFTFSGIGTSRTVLLTVPATAYGSATITVTVANGLTTASASFLFTVTPTSIVPTISDIQDKTVNEDSNNATRTVSFTIENVVSSPTLSATSTNTALVPSFTFGGSGTSRTVRMNVPANANGSGTITVTVSNGPFSASDTFLFTVNAVNDRPTFTKGADQIVDLNSGQRTVTGWATAMSTGPADESGQTLTGFIVTNDNNAFFSEQPAVDLNGTLTFTPAPWQNGGATVTVQLQDNGSGVAPNVNLSTAQTFTIGVSSTTLLVTNTNDVGTGSLRAQIAAALNDTGSRPILFAPSLSGQTITLGSEIVIDDPTSADLLSIDASGLPGGLTIDGGPGTNRIFTLSSNDRAVLSGLTLTGGNGGGAASSGNGGAICINTSGTLTLTQCTFAGNSADSGGAICSNNGALNMTNCTLSGNSAGWGGAIYNRVGALTLTQCTLSQNTSTGMSGAIYNIGTLSLTQCTLSGNSAVRDGGAISNQASLSVTDCTISGNSAGNGGAISTNSGTLTLTDCKLSGNTADFGGAIYNFLGALTLTQCTLSENTSLLDYGGGAVYNQGTLTLTQCTLSGNLAADGGVIFNASGTLTLTACTLSGNSATSGGGAIFNNLGPLTLIDCTLSGNKSTGRGGAIHNSDGLTLMQCTFSGNSADHSGGAIYHNSGALQLTQCSLSGNSANDSGGAVELTFYGTLTLTNSLVAENTAPAGPDIYKWTGGSGSSINRNGANLIGKNNTVDSQFPSGFPNANGDFVGTSAAPLAPLLAPLGNYGGPTQTMALLPGSPARNAATVLVPAITADQRGFPIAGVPDIGAYEAGTINRYDTWIWETLPTPGNGTLTDPLHASTFDYDGDGQRNVLEYATRGNPLVFTGSPMSAPTPIAGPARQLTFPYRTGVTDLRYIIERGTTLAGWTEIYRFDTSTNTVTETGVTAEESPTTQFITLTDPATGPANFWRLRVEMVP